MTDVTQQLVSAMNQLLASHANLYHMAFSDPARGIEADPDADIVRREAIEALTAFEASRAAPAEDVVDQLVPHLAARFLAWKLPPDFHPDAGISFVPDYNNGTPQGGRHEPTGTNLLNAEQAFAMVRHLLDHPAFRAALSAMPRDEGLEGLLAKALRRLAFWAQTSGGTAGRDDGLVAAIDVGLAALRQYDTKLAQEPRS